jgi:hypothetical protein
LLSLRQTRRRLQRSLRQGLILLLETHYTVLLWRGIHVAPGPQHINHPG